MVSIQTMMGSRFIAGIRDDVEAPTPSSGLPRSAPALALLLVGVGA